MTSRFSSEAEARIAEIIKQYPDRKSAIMSALYIVQEERGYLDQQGIEWISEKIGVAPVHVMEVATFYTMYYKKPVGKYHFQICRTLSCALCGGKQITEYLQKRLGIQAGEISKDGMWSFEEVECLGSCGTAPMIEINDTYFENLTLEKLESVINLIEERKPDLRLSTVRDQLGAGLVEFPKSEVI